MTEPPHYNSHSISFSEKSIKEKTHEYAKHLLSESGTFLATSLTLWGAAGIISAASNQTLETVELAAPILLISAVISIKKSIENYATEIPAILENESSEAKKEFKKQKCGWNIRLAQELIKKRTIKTEKNIERIFDNSIYFEVKNLGNEEYIDWALKRISEIDRLVNTGTTLLLKYLPKKIGRTTDPSSIEELILEINYFNEFLRQVERYERESREIEPPASFRNIHQLSYGWTKVIFAAIQDFHTLLDDLGKITKSDVKKGISLEAKTIEIDSPPNMEAYAELVNQAYSKLP